MMNVIEMGGNPVDEETLVETVVEAPPAEPVEEKVKKSRPKRAAKKAVKAVAKAVSTAWNLGGTMTLHTCRLSGPGISPKDRDQRSFWAAWQKAEMGYGRGRHIKLRGQLKASIKAGGTNSLTYPRQSDGKKFTFTLVDPAKPES